MAEVALGLLDEPSRSEVLAHVAGCANCRRDFDELVRATDGLLAMAPEAEPPPGFEQRVLARIDAAEREAPMVPLDTAVPHRRRRRRVPLFVAVAAAVVALLVGGAIGLAAQDEGGGGGGELASVGIRDIATAILRNDDGEEVGRAALSSDGVPVLLVQLNRSRPGVSYGCQLVLEDGETISLGEWTTPDDGGGGWSAPLPELASTPVEVRVTGASGNVWATGQLT